MLDQTYQPASRPQPDQIAELTDDQLARLNYDEMVRVILASGMSVRNVERIHTFEGVTVLRLARCARNFCRKSHNRQPEAQRAPELISSD